MTTSISNSFSSAQMSLMRGLMAVISAVALPACLGADTTDAPPQDDAFASTFDTTLDLISPATCALAAGRLRNCAFPTTIWTPFPIQTAVPLRTKVVANVSGTCSTQFPLEVTFLAANMPDTPMAFLSNRTVNLRRASGAAFADLRFIDLSPWTAIASFDQSCRVSLQIAFNEVDVDSENDAVAILARLDDELAEKTRIRDRAVQLLKFANAFDFVEELLSAFHQQLTNEQMRDLRRLSIDHANVMADLIAGCDVVGPDGQHFPTTEQRQGLSDLFFALGTLGDPDLWNHPDGSPVSIAEFLGPEQAQILNTLNTIIDATDGTNPAVYAAEAETAATAVADVAARIVLARAQLAAWL
jgi:hypothetical protein